MNALQLSPAKARPNLIANWLLFAALLVFAMVVVGGITRLTESGLSITEWKPVTGTLPPLSEAAWMEAFNKYKAIPEYTQINGPAGMALAEFKFIFFWEWVHRLLGRVVGMALILPWLFFVISRKIPAGYASRIFGIGMLVALQGTIGWWMVSSGLTQRTDVSHFRLAIHLLTALFIMAGLVWTALDLKTLMRDPEAKPARMVSFAGAILAVIFIQLLFGAWVAGMNAGQVSNTWPLMNDRLFPEGVDWSAGTLFAAANDPYLVHFIHRWWAWVAFVALILMARRVKATGARSASVAIHVALGFQILLGIATVMSGVGIVLAVLHQAVGALLVASVARGAHILGQQRAAVTTGNRHMQPALA